MPTLGSKDPIARLVDPTVFTKTLDFAGIFQSEDLKTKPLSIQIRYSPINAHNPTGIILGASDDHDDLEHFFMAKSQPLCRLESISSAEVRPKICSKEILLKAVARTHWSPAEDSTIQQIIGRFEIFDLSIEHSFSPGSTESRQITFFMTGHHESWMSHTFRELSYSGNIKTTAPRARMPIGALRDVRLLARPHFFYTDRYEVERIMDPHDKAEITSAPFPRMQAEAQIFGLTVIDREPDRDDEVFEARAHAVAETLCLIVSFLAKAHVDWFGTSLFTGERLVDNFRPIDSPSPERRAGWMESVLDPADIRSFLSKAFSAYTKHAMAGVDLRLPIILYVAAQTAPTIDESFILLFRGLEKLIAVIEDRQAGRPLLQTDELEALREAIRSELKTLRKPKRVRGAVYKNVGGLARHSFKHRLLRQLHLRRVGVEDIGGDQGLSSMIVVRNKLIHSGEHIDIEDIIREYGRFETVVERMLLRLLGWRGRTNTPTSTNRGILAQP